jgi:hypothetical protein
MGARFFMGELGMIYVLLEEAAEAGVRVEVMDDKDVWDNECGCEAVAWAGP